MSKAALLFSLLVIVLAHLFYPKWQKSGSEATISYDASGYYMYLPAIFIYQDIKECKFHEEILRKYRPISGFEQAAFIHRESGNYVMKYSAGQAVVSLPAFFIAHAWASADPAYPPDGFSHPYQLLISLNALLLCFIGLFFMRKVLLRYFSEKVTALSLFALVVGTNYLNYAAIDGAMTHNTLFTLYALLLWLTVKFYEKPDLKKSLGIGALVGLAALVRPTEIISCLLPLLWGVNLASAADRKQRLQFFGKHWKILLPALLVTAAVGFIQLGYWKYTSGDWVVYSYQEQGFSWFSPHFNKAMFSYRAGWLVYTPLMFFALIGFVFMYRAHRRLFYPVAVFSLLFAYIAFAWDVWWYGGSLGQRAMVQSYPVLLFPLCFFIKRVLAAGKIFRTVAVGLALLFCYANLWFTYQAHGGGLFHVSLGNKEYFWATLFRYENNPEYLKLLDGVKEIYEGELHDAQVILQAEDYEQRLNADRQHSAPTVVSTETAQGYDWLRVSVETEISQKEWNVWKMSQFIVVLKNKGEEVSTDVIRIQRYIDNFAKKRIHIDVYAEGKAHDALEVRFWNADGNREIILRDLRVTAYNED